MPFIIGLFLVIYASLGAVYFKGHTGREDLNSQITRNRTILQRPHPNLEELKKQLSQAEAALATFPRPEQSIELFDALIDVARESKVELISIQAASPVQKQDKDISYTLLPFNIMVQGSRENLLIFVIGLEQGAGLLGASQINSIDISSSPSPGAPYLADVQVYVQAKPTFVEEKKEEKKQAPTSGQRKGK